jgi:Domain of unknown function (DUF4177)
MPKFEYLVVDTYGLSGFPQGGYATHIETQTLLNEYGSKGWELVSASAMRNGDATLTGAIYYFKRLL